jgi:hypothetical protein
LKTADGPGLAGDDMRKEADIQIDYAEERASDAEEEIKYLKRRFKNISSGTGTVN